MIVRDGPALALQDEAARATLLPGDKVVLRIFEELTLSGEYLVDDEGNLVLPKLGILNVEGVEVQNFPDSLRTWYSEYLRNPAVEVTVLRRIGVHGEVTLPTLYWVDLTMTLRDAVALAGGVTPLGDPNRILLVRGDQQMEMKGYGRTALLGIGLQSGDQVIVARRSWLSLNAQLVVTAGISVFSVVSGILLAR